MEPVSTKIANDSKRKVMGLMRSPLLDKATEKDEVTLTDGATKHH